MLGDGLRPPSWMGSLQVAVGFDVVGRHGVDGTLPIEYSEDESVVLTFQPGPNALLCRCGRDGAGKWPGRDILEEGKVADKCRRWNVVPKMKWRVKLSALYLRQAECLRVGR